MPDCFDASISSGLPDGPQVYPGGGGPRRILLPAPAPDCDYTERNKQRTNRCVFRTVEVVEEGEQHEAEEEREEDPLPEDITVRLDVEEDHLATDLTQRIRRVHRPLPNGGDQRCRLPTGCV